MDNLYRACPFCQETVSVGRGMYDRHLLRTHRPCPAGGRPVSWRTTVKAALQALYTIMGG